MSRGHFDMKPGDLRSHLVEGHGLSFDDVSGGLPLEMHEAEHRRTRCPSCGLTVRIPKDRGSHGCPDPWHGEPDEA